MSNLRDRILNLISISRTDEETLAQEMKRKKAAKEARGPQGDDLFVPSMMDTPLTVKREGGGRGKIVKGRMAGRRGTRSKK